MITRIFIDNYKCFVNFELALDPLVLVLGENGSGKTTLLDVLESVRDFIVRGTPAIQAFPTNTLTAWDSRAQQTMEIGVAGNGGQYNYRVAIDHDRRNSRNRIKTEELRFDDGTQNRPLYQFDGSDAHLFRDNGTAGPQFPFDWSRSAIATIPERPENQLLTWFRRRLEKVYIFSPDPLRMSATSEAELAFPDRRLHQLVSWLRHLSQESVEMVSKLRDQLRDEVIAGLAGFRLERVSEASRVLKFDFQLSEGAASTSFSLSFDQLSDGQRNLMAIYTVLHAAAGPDVTIAFDEADNYVALREIQPWLAQLRDRVEEQHSQSLLISHHPESINYLAGAHGLLLVREESGFSRAKAFQSNGDDGLLPAELLARGWQ